MAQQNESSLNGAEQQTGSNSGNGGGNSGKDPVIDIKKYLHTREGKKVGKSIAGLLEVLFKEKFMKASEWPAEVTKAIERRVAK